MLTVRVSLGSPTDGAQYALGKVVAANVSDLAPVSSYVVGVRDDRGLHTLFHLVDHQRDEGAWELVRRIAEAIVARDMPPVPDGLDMVAHVLEAELRHP